MSTRYLPAVSREKAIRAAAESLVDAVAERAARAPREAAEAAYYPGHPLGSVEAIEDEIIARRKAEAEQSAGLTNAA